MIDHSQLSYQEKEEQKRQMKRSLEVFIQGVKDEMKAKGRMIWGLRVLLVAKLCKSDKVERMVNG